jgi:hypothetical protein
MFCYIEFNCSILIFFILFYSELLFIRDKTCYMPANGNFKVPGLCIYSVLGIFIFLGIMFLS